MRRYPTAVFILFVLTSSAQAGLQSALTTALTGLQSVPVPLGVRLTPIGASYASPEGSLFVDAATSTRGEPVFREGPDFSYDPSTGGVSISAPPMLGPADELGVRSTYSPVSVTVYAEGLFAETRSLPQLTKYHRADRNYSSSTWEYEPFDDDDPSFVIDEESDSFQVSVSSNQLTVGLDSYWRSFTSAEVEFASLLQAGLSADVFEGEEASVLDNSIWPYYPYFEGELPAAYIVVEYQTQNNYSSQFSGWYSLLAVPQEIGVSGTVPEPTTVALAGVALAGLLVTCRTQSRC